MLDFFRLLEFIWIYDKIHIRKMIKSGGRNIESEFLFIDLCSDFSTLVKRLYTTTATKKIYD